MILSEKSQNKGAWLLIGASPFLLVTNQGCFCGRLLKKWHAGHKLGVFLWPTLEISRSWSQNRDVFVAGYGLDFISLRDLTEKYKLTQYKMAEFIDEIPILYQLLRDNIHHNFLREIWMERKNTYICR